MSGITLKLNPMATNQRLCGWLSVWVSLVVGLRSEPAADFQVALACYREAHYSEARMRFERIAAGRPAEPELDFYLGRLALWFDDGAQGLAHLERAAQREPQSARIQNALGDAYGLAAQQANILAKFGWAKKCRAAYERAVELEPGNGDYRWSLLGYYFLAPRIAGGGLELAYAQAAEIKKIDPMSGRVAFATLYLAEKKTAQAFAEFDDVLARTPDDFMALYHVGRCAALSGEQLDRGIAALERCLALPPPPGEGKPRAVDVHYRLANLLEKKGELARARAEYAKSLRENPDFRPAKVALKK